MNRRLRRTFVGGCVAAAPVIGPGLACDRSSPPPAGNVPVAVPSEEESKPNSSLENSNTPSQPLEPKPAESAKTNQVLPEPSNASANSNGTFVPPEVDLTAVPEFERDQILKIRERVIEAPGSADRIAELGMQYCVRGFDDAAAACFKRAIELMPRVMRFHYLLAVSYDEETQSDKAIKAFQAALALDAKYPAIYVNLGKILIKTDPIEARDMFDKAIELDATDSIAHWGLGSCALASGNEEKALGYFRKAIELQPNYADAHREISQILRKRGEIKESDHHAKLAAEGRKGLVRNDPIRFELSTRLRSEEDIAKEAVDAARQGKPDQALQYLVATVRKGIHGAPIRRALGEVLVMSGKPDEAVIQFREALKLAPDSVATQILMSSALIDVGELDQAEAMLNEIAAKEPKRHEVANRLGVIDVKRGRFVEGEKKFRAALDADPGNGLYRFALAQCVALQGRNGDALEAANRTLEILPNDAGVHLLKGQTLLLLKKPVDAKASLQKAMELNPNMEQAYLLLAGVARDENDHAASIRFLEQGIKQLPDSLVIANDLSYSLATCPNDTLRDPECAIDLAKRACNSTLNQNVNFLDTLATAYAAAGDFTKAVEALHKAIDRAELLKASDSEIAGLKTRRSEYESRMPKQ